MTAGLTDRRLAAIVAVLAANERVERAVLFGSRATGTHSPASDVDIALFGDRLTDADRAALDEAFEASAIPQRVDPVLHATIGNAALREHIAREGVELYRARPGPRAGA